MVRNQTVYFCCPIPRGPAFASPPQVFSFHPGLGRLVEVGNSGVFRPEMLRPMGLPEDVVVIAWGLSLERSVSALCLSVHISLRMLPPSMYYFVLGLSPVLCCTVPCRAVL